MANTNNFFNANQTPEWGDYEVAAEEEVTPTKTKAEIYQEQIPSVLKKVRQSLEAPIYNDKSEDYFKNKVHEKSLNDVPYIMRKSQQEGWGKVEGYEDAPYTEEKENDFPYEITFDRKGRPFANVNGTMIPLDDYNAPELIEEEEYVYPQGRPTSTNQFSRPMLDVYKTLSTNEWTKANPNASRIRATVLANRRNEANKKFGRYTSPRRHEDAVKFGEGSDTTAYATELFRQKEAKAQKAEQLKALMNEFTDEEIAQIMGGE